MTMKRHLITYDISEKDELKQCLKTSLTILGNRPTMVGEDRRDATESYPNDCKRRKLESQDQETSTYNEETNDRTNKSRFLELVSSAVILLAEREKEEEEMRSQQQTQPEQTSSEVSVTSTTRTSRSNSITSEISTYRSHDIELPNQPALKQFMDTCVPLRAPRLPTAAELPIIKKINLQLQSRHYRERPVFIDSNEGKKNQIIASNRLKRPFLIQTVNYR